MTDRKPLILNAVDLSDPPGDQFKVALFAEAPEPAPAVDHGYARFDWHADTFAVVAGSGTVVWTWAWMKPAPSWRKLPYSRLSKSKWRRGRR